ncbi:hypothetical protein GH714_029964 [Hevea brasiliensis]|uniref:RRP15-like protein n=1 Tax=Hevea brasiliensis TaxID=3981 RepID=A0A6A6K7L6_HEVBR|nr:hypothetical protein GH714_029795 [Hevea brasiliensis]KAF2284761.1 hypothetical protein GH714_029964 [Hevea brasiliensis]
MKKLLRNKARDYNFDDDDDEDESAYGTGVEKAVSFKDDDKDDFGMEVDGWKRRGHVKPAYYLDAHESFLWGLLQKEVNKAQNAQKGLDPSRTKDAKVIKRRRKEAFFSKLGKTPVSVSDPNAKVHKSSGAVDSEGPSWAPLRDNFMLTNSKLKDWDRMPDKDAADDIGKMSEDSGSDDD